MSDGEGVADADGSGRWAAWKASVLWGAVSSMAPTMKRTGYVATMCWLSTHLTTGSAHLCVSTVAERAGSGRFPAHHLPGPPVRGQSQRLRPGPRPLRGSVSTLAHTDHGFLLLLCAAGMHHVFPVGFVQHS